MVKAMHPQNGCLCKRFCLHTAACLNKLRKKIKTYIIYIYMINIYIYDDDYYYYDDDDDDEFAGFIL